MVGIMKMAQYYLSMEIGGTNLRYGVINEMFQVLEFKKEPSIHLSNAENKGEYIEALIRPYVEQYGKENFKCMTLSLASLMNKERTVNYNSPNIRGLDHISLVDILSKRLNMAVYMERDVNTALLYEIWRENIDHQGMIVGIFIGTGLGNAMCIDGKLYIGNSGSACELGHIPVLGFAEPCGCGKKGCIELKASGKTLYQLAEKKYHCEIGDLLEQYGQEEDVMEVIYACAIAAATEIAILDPRYVVLGGGVVEMKAFPMEYFERVVRENLRIPYPRESISFIRASGAPEAGIVGAAINAFHRING